MKDIRDMEGKIIDTRMNDLRIYEGRCPTLRAQRDGVLYVKNHTIYQLTGYETLLLQGFPKEYADRVKDEVSDRHLLMQAGNAMTVNVIKLLGQLVFILDKSGSMSGLENDTIGGFNSMLEKQKAVDGECRITTVLFDNSYTLLHDRIDIHAVSPMTNTEYFVGGSTALLDAIGLTINKLVSVQRNTAEDYRADKVMFVIITDGEENSSREYSADKVRSMIEHEKEKYGWEFIFLGANIDAVQTAQRFGIDADRAVDYIPDAKGTQLNFEAMAETVACYRMTGAVPAEPMEEIRKDMKKRGGRK